MRASRPPRRRARKAASVALGSCALPTMSRAASRAASRSGAQGFRVRLDVARERDGRDARPAHALERVELACVAPGRDNAGRAQRNREQNGGASVSPGRAGHNDGFAGGEARADEAAVRNGEPREHGELHGVDRVQSVDRRHRRLRRSRIFGERSVAPVRLKRLACGTGGNAQEKLRRLRDVLVGDHMRGDHDALAGLQMIDLGADLMDDFNRVASGREPALRRTVDREPAFNVGFQIGHERRSLDLDDDAARPRLRDRRVVELEGSAEAVEQPGFHGRPLRHTLDPANATSLPASAPALEVFGRLRIAGVRASIELDARDLCVETRDRRIVVASHS